jgi:hypothetical protein
LPPTAPDFNREEPARAQLIFWQGSWGVAFLIFPRREIFIQFFWLDLAGFGWIWLVGAKKVVLLGFTWFYLVLPGFTRSGRATGNMRPET